MVKTGPVLADTIYLPMATWTFWRKDQRIVLERLENDGGYALVVIADEQSRSIQFSERPALITFQNDMEEFLLHTGWSLLHFSPDRRLEDRRTFPRISSDRRRWWTDGLPQH